MDSRRRRNVVTLFEFASERVFRRVVAPRELMIIDLTMNDPYVQTVFAASEFVRRRSTVASAIGQGLAVLQGTPATGAFDVLRQFNDFFYLCGVEVPHAYLTIDGRNDRSVLYLLPADAESREQEGAELSADTPEIALRVTGCDDVKPLSALLGDLRSAESIFVCHSPQEGGQACQDTLGARERSMRDDPCRSKKECFADFIARHCGDAQVSDLSPILAAMRQIKSSAEVALMRRAGQITSLAVMEAMRSTAPGLIELQLGAVADYIFKINGARGGGYRPIIACGDNIWNMHYYRNSDHLIEGELVLMDYAPELSCYTCDIGRMWPVSGRYEPWQRELYGFVVDYHHLLLNLISPGKMGREICQQAAQQMLPIVERTRWSRPAFKEALLTMIQSGKPFTHGVGMSIHEGPTYQCEILKPGHVFALDPQLWVPAERLYVRVEDTVVVTENGIENLTADCPRDLDEVERVMSETGMIQSHPDSMIA